MALPVHIKNFKTQTEMNSGGQAMSQPSAQFGTCHGDQGRRSANWS